MQRIGQRLRRYLMTGLIVIAPIGVTVWVLSWLFLKLDPIIGRYLPRIYGYEPRGLGLVALLAAPDHRGLGFAEGDGPAGASSLERGGEPCSGRAQIVQRFLARIRSRPDP